MAYFLGSDVKVALTTEHETYGLQVAESGSSGFYELSSAASPANGINKLSLGNLGTDNALVDVTGLDLGIGAMDEEVTYLGHRTPLKAEVHKETTISITLKRKNAVYDVIFTGDKDSVIGRWGIGTNIGANAMGNGLSEPIATYGFRIAIYIKSGKEVFTILNCTFTGHSISLNADGTQEETLDFSSQVEPIIDDVAYETATTEGQL